MVFNEIHHVLISLFFCKYIYFSAICCPLQSKEKIIIFRHIKKFLKGLITNYEQNFDECSRLQYTAYTAHEDMA
jgi:hypothetical protein